MEVELGERCLELGSVWVVGLGEIDMWEGPGGALADPARWVSEERRRLLNRVREGARGGAQIESGGGAIGFRGCR